MSGGTLSVSVWSQSQFGPGSLNTTKSANVTLYSAPLMQSVYSIDGFLNPITSNGTIVVAGQGFEKNGGNILTFTRSGYSPVTITAGTNNMIEGSLTTIQVALGGRLASGGPWGVSVISPNEPSSPSGIVYFSVQ